MADDHGFVWPYFLGGALVLLSFGIAAELYAHVLTDLRSSLDVPTSGWAFAVEAIGFLLTLTFAYPLGMVMNMIAYSTLNVLGRRKRYAAFEAAIPSSMMRDLKSPIDDLLSQAEGAAHWLRAKDEWAVSMMRMRVQILSPGSYAEQTAVWDGRSRFFRVFFLANLFAFFGFAAAGLAAGSWWIVALATAALCVLNRYLYLHTLEAELRHLLTRYVALIGFGIHGK
jgi:hypothetical protein